MNPTRIVSLNHKYSRRVLILCMKEAHEPLKTDFIVYILIGEIYQENELEELPNNPNKSKVNFNNKLMKAMLYFLTFKDP